MTKPIIQWHEWPVTPADGGDFGHGIHYHDAKQRRDRNLVAFIDGFEWLHDDAAVVNGYHAKPNKITTARVLAAMKRRIESLVAQKILIGDGMISRRISACANA